LPEVERATGSSGRAIRQQGTPNNKRPVLHNDNTPHKMINLALVGATGLVGQMMVKVLEEQKIPVAGFYPAASERSVGKKAHLNGKEYKVCSIAEAVDARPDIALFSAGGDVSREWAGKFAANGTYVIDNSSAWRMDPKVPLVVPEVNPHAIGQESRIIANPNCSTIQLVVVLSPLHKRYGIKRVVVSTYQSVTGTGVKAVRQLENERKGKAGEMAYPHQIDLNCFPHGGDFLENGYTSEEMKLVNESRKILGFEKLALSATVVRIPVMGGHSEAVNIELEQDFYLQEVRDLISGSPGIIVQDEPERNFYPMPFYSGGKDAVFVGRIRRDTSLQSGLDLWIVSDNLRKGAATNAVQIARLLIEKGYVKS
jgi:aspartate-semialdehyde dehydrogenase